MDVSFKGILFFILTFQAPVETEVFKDAWIKTLSNNTAGMDGKTYIPDDVSLDIITDDEVFSFSLKRTKRQNRNIPVITTVRNIMQRLDFEMQKKGVEVFRMRNASFALKFENGKISSCRGFFYTANLVYTVQPNSGRLTSHLILIQPYQAFEFSVEESTSGQEELLPMTKIHRTKWRTKRQTKLYEIELFVVVDFALFSQLTPFKQTKTNSSEALEETLEDIVHQFAVIVSGIDARFRGIQGSGYVIDVIFAGIYIAQTKLASSWSEAVKEDSTTRPVVNEKSMKLFIDWMKRHQHSLPEFDHAMAFTGYNLRKEDNHKTLGLGYTQSMCTDRRFSIVEHHGDAAYVSYIATHELAHSLGAKHDGYPARVVYGDREKTCRADSGYIMCPKASRDPDAFVRKWQFSDCSLLYFEFFMNHLNENKTNCLSKRSSWYKGKDSAVYMEVTPSVYSPDEQCERKHGDGYVLDRKVVGENISTICHSIPCINPSAREPLVPTLPLEGTVCGHQRICHLGQCVDGTSNIGYERKSSKEDCVFGDQPGVIAGTGQNCQELLDPLHLAYKCYTYDKQCCHTCSRHLRQFTAIENCPYGDRKGSCSIDECETGLCCETCAVLTGKIRECPVFNTPDQGNVTFNTGNIHHGTVATFSCTRGRHLIGNRTSTCLEDGLWDSASPECPRGCFLPTPRPHTLIEHANDDVVEFGSTIRIKCENGFVLEGNHTVECKEDTSWDDSFPNCILGFTSPSTIYIPENIPSGAVVHQVSTGSALSVYRMVYFTLPGFKVTEDGSVEVDDNRELNFEDMQSYTLVIEATSIHDTRFKAKQRLVIHVKDVNEFEPKFARERYCISLQKPLIEGMTVFTVFAADEDASGFNISYKIQSSADIADTFRIESLTGVITVSNAEQLNTSGNRVYMLVILATDSGKPQLTGTCVVQINYEQECQQNGATALTCGLKNYGIVIVVMYKLYVVYLFLKRIMH